MKNFYSLLRMKGALALLCLVGLSLAAVSCEEDDPARIWLSTETMNFGFAASRQTVEVHSNNPWTATVTPEEAQAWCSVSIKESIEPSETLTVYVEDNDPNNPRAEQRHATIVFSTGCNGSNPMATLHVTQDIMPEQN